MKKKLQIIFTTHSDLILNFKSLINIRHIYIADNKNAYCFNDTNPKLLYQLTGNQAKKLRLFVEDELSKQIVFKIAGQVGIRQFVKIDTFGPAINCFTTAAGAVLNGLDISNSLFIIDGDVYRTREDKKERIQEVITGKDYQSRRKQVKALQAIMEFILPDGIKPEKFFHSKIIGADSTTLNPEYLEIKEAATNIHAVDDSHNFIGDIIKRLGYDTNDYRVIVDFLSGLPFWGNYINPIKEWLQNKKNELKLYL